MTPEMPFRASLHTHNSYCDGTSSIRQVVEAAIHIGMEQIGISSHAPLPFETDWTMSLDDLPRYQDELLLEQQVHVGKIRVLRGLEIDYIPSTEIEDFQVSRIVPSSFDYFIGSVHFLGFSTPPTSFDGTEKLYRQILEQEYSGSIEAMVRDYYARVAKLADFPKVRIIGHLDVIKRWNHDNRYFTGEEKWYREAVEDALDAIARSQVMVELNTAGWRKGLKEPYPAPWILNLCRRKFIPVTITADAHTPADIAWGFGDAQALLRELKIEPTTIRAA